MSRNTKKEYLQKVINSTPDGYKFDIVNYLYNPAYGYEYPAFIKKIDETETTETVKRIYYFKHYDGTGEYNEEIYSRKKDVNGWQVVEGRTEKLIEKSNRYSLNKLISLCV